MDTTLAGLVQSGIGKRSDAKANSFIGGIVSSIKSLKEGITVNKIKPQTSFTAHIRYNQIYKARCATQ